jgi:tetratricopeptide (TPR) repeat protein
LFYSFQGLTELYEAIGNYKKVVEACDTVISLYQAIGNQAHLNDYRRRLASAYAALAEHEKALRYWATFLEDPSLSEPLYLEALCGTIDAKTAIMENCIQKVYNIYLTEDNELDKSLARQNAENEWLRSGEHIKMEEMLLEVLNRRPYSEKYEALLLQLLVWRMRTHSPTKGSVQKFVY